MRSRYSAYVLDDADYLSQTWHPDFRPGGVTVDPDVHFIGLTINASSQQGKQAVVDFEARLLANGQVQAMHEKSTFVEYDGRWMYTTGEILTPSFRPWTPGRNETCPCGSGKKYKRCCV